MSGQQSRQARFARMSLGSWSSGKAERAWDAAAEHWKAHRYGSAHAAEEYALRVEIAESTCAARFFSGWWRCGNALCGRCYQEATP